MALIDTRIWHLGAATEILEQHADPTVKDARTWVKDRLPECGVSGHTVWAEISVDGEVVIGAELHNGTVSWSIFDD